MLKSLTLTSKASIFFFTKNKSTYIFLEIESGSAYSLRIPIGLKIKWEKSNDTLLLSCYSSLDILFYQKLLNFSKPEKPVSKLKMSLKGLGYKINLTEQGRFLEFKLGYSHLSLVAIPKSVKVFVSKNVLLFESYDKEVLGNFVHKIYRLRPADDYKGRGFVLKNRSLRQKTIKKK